MNHLALIFCSLAMIVNVAGDLGQQELLRRQQQKIAQLEAAVTGLARLIVALYPDPPPDEEVEEDDPPPIVPPHKFS